MGNHEVVTQFTSAAGHGLWHLANQFAAQQVIFDVAVKRHAESS